MLMLFGGGGAVPEPDAILGASILQWVRGDQGISESSGRISAWNDISGNGLHYSQGTGGAQPLYDATGGPNGLPIVRVDSNARFMTSALNLAEPGTTATTIWMVARQIGWVLGWRLCDGGGGGATHIIRQGATATPDLNQFNASHVNTNSALTINSWGRVEAYFSNSTGDYLKALSTSVTGASAGNSSSTGRSIGSGSGTSSAVFDIAELIYINRALTAGEKTQLDAYCTARYGAGLV
jgi:hypothetical protein